MINKYKSEIKPNINMTASTVVTESKSYTRTTTTVTTTGGYSRTEFQSTSSGPVRSILSSNISPVSNLQSTGTSALPPSPRTAFLRLTDGRSSYHPPSSTTNYTSTTPPFRSAFNNQPGATYRSFNLKKPVNCTPEKQPDETEKKSSGFFGFRKSDKEKEQIKKAKEEAKAKKERERKEKETKEIEKKLKEAREKEERKRQRQAKKLKDKDQKNKIITTYDARAVTANTNNGFSINLGDMEKKLVIKVIKTRKFYPLEDDKIPTYKTKSRFSRGMVLVINNIEFSGNRYRNGADVDHKNISTLCKEMGFKVTSHKNKSEKEMNRIIADYCRNSSLKSADIHITVIMSHGNGEMNNTYIETIDGHLVSIETIVNQFSNERCLYLANKPKIFIFQCCRGKDEDVLGNRPPETDAISFQAPRNNADMLLAYATVPGFVSHRDGKMGTWYIQSICKTFTEHAHDTDVENLLKIVDENLEKTYKTHRQTSSYENRGFKRCFLNPI